MTFDVFDYTYNGIEFSVLFDIGSKPYFRIIFIKKRTELFLILDIKNGYYLDAFLGDKLDILKRMLEIHGGRVEFSTNVFFSKFNEKIPSTISRKELKLITISKIYKCEESEKVYIKYLQPWDEYPWLKKNVSPENREKTRVLYPEIYENIKEKNVSVFYTDRPKESTRKGFRI